MAGFSKCGSASGWTSGWASQKGSSNRGSDSNPCSFTSVASSAASISCKEPPLRIDGDADRYDHRDGNDDYRQAGDLYRLMDEEAKARLVNNIADAMEEVPQEIQLRQVGHFTEADPKYGRAIAKLLRVNGHAA